MTATIKPLDDPPGQFDIVLSDNATPEEKALKDRFDQLRIELQKRADKPEFAPLLQRLQTAARLALVGVNGASPNPLPAMESLGAIRADFQRLQARTGRFKVKLPNGPRDPSPRDLVFEFDNDDKTEPVPTDQLKLKADIEDTLTTLQVVFAEKDLDSGTALPRLRRFLLSLFGIFDDPPPPAPQVVEAATKPDATLKMTVPASAVTIPPNPPPAKVDTPASASRDQRRFEEYQLKLWSLAQVGLQGDASPDTARLALSALQDEILRREGPRIKNSYMRRLGLWAIAFGGATAIAYLMIRNNHVFSVQLSAFNNLLLLWTGTMIGAWLSFGLRKPTITITDLSGLESDMVEPPLRLLFTGLIAITISFIFLTGMVNVMIGGLKSTELLAHGTTALVIGLMLGVSEQALPGALTRRASQFVNEVAGR